MRFLCTTALEHTWRDDEPVLFLGEWCRRHSRKERWSMMDAEVLPYHWDDRAQLYADYLRLREVHERLLQELTVQFNEIHNTDHGLRYWRILIGPWVGYFVQMLFDRWTSIQRAINQYKLSGTIVLFGREESLVPNDMADFARLFVGDEWNHHLYAAILQQFTQVPCSKRQRNEDGLSDAAQSGGWKQRVRRTLVQWYAPAASLLSRDRDAFLLNTYLPLLDEMRIQRRLGQVPQLWGFVRAPRIAADPNRRQWRMIGENRSEFEVCARKLIPQQIPTIYLEGYRRMVQQTASLPWPKRPKVIWTSNAHRSDDVFMAWAAQKAEQGSPLVIGQHGGHYGTGRWCFAEDHDIEICDRYLSWGWSEPRQPKIKPVGQWKAKKPRDVRQVGQPRALLVTCALPRYSYWMYSAPVSQQWLEYFGDQCAFVERLPRLIQDALTVRLYPDDLGWDQMSRWRDRFPELCLDQGRCNINDLIRQSRLYISTYNATTFLESFTMNVPTVIYWNVRHWELRESACSYFEDLKRVGIFHETPRSASDHVAAIWSDVGAWWSSSPVQEALDRFKLRYCHLPNDLLDRVETALRDVVNEVEKTVT